jgi:hypothetical protein
MIEAVFGIIGNLVVLLVYTKYVQDKTVTRYFIPVLAVVDLVGCLSNVVYFYLDNTMGYTFPSVYLCKLLSFLRIMIGGLSANLILVIALQRYLLICRPLGQQLTRKYGRICIFIVVLFSFGYAAPMLKCGNIYDGMSKFSIGNDTHNVSISICQVDRSEALPYLGTLLFLSFINIVVTSALYIPVTKAIYKTLSSSRLNKVPNVLDADANVDPKGNECVTIVKITGADMPPQDAFIHKLTVSTKNVEHGKENARKMFSIMFFIIIVVYVVSYLVSLATKIHSFGSGIPQRAYEINKTFSVFMQT